MKNRNGAEEGQVAVLALGLCVVSFAVAGLAVDGARVWILRRSLQAAVDAAAASAANALDTSSFYRSGGVSARLDPERARWKAASMLAARGLPARLEIVAGSRVVRAKLRTRLETSFLSLVGIEDLPVTAEATARPLMGDP